MSALHAQRRDDGLSGSERIGSARGSSGSRQHNSHPYSPILSSVSNSATNPSCDGAQPRSSSATSTVANLAALVPPSMRTRTAAAEHKDTASSDSNSNSARRRRTTAAAAATANGLAPLAQKSSTDSVDTGTGYRSVSPPRQSPANLSPPRERRGGSSVSDVSSTTVEEDAAITPPAPSITSNNRIVSAADYAPLSDAPAAPEDQVPPQLPKLARPRFGHEPASVPKPPSPKPMNAHEVAQAAAATPAASPRTTPSPKSAAAADSAAATPPQKSASSPAASTPHQPESRSSHSTDEEKQVQTPPPAPSTAERTPPSKQTPPPPTNVSPCSRLPPPPLRHGGAATTSGEATLLPSPAPGSSAASALPPIAPRHLRTLTDDAAEDTGFTPLPELPPTDKAAKKPQKLSEGEDRHAHTRAATAERRTASNRPRSARRPTQSVQTARARAQQRRTAASSSPHARGTPVTPIPEAFPGAKRLDDDRVSLSTKLVLGTACAVGLALVFYLGRSVYSYASVNIMEASDPAPLSKFAQARLPKKVEVTDKEAAKIAREIRDRIVTNMQSAIQ